jgi:peptidoglycan/LPS O-acetylase OafA/YrhL
MKYRSEINGLRALAVVPVILFHAGFDIVSGGYVGVDVFFVISGYLITTILIEDIENNRFSLVSFYERRARRILPALFLVILVCIPFAWLLMLPNEMLHFSRSLVAVSLFFSNILFWRESGYFEAASEEKPLLHTWSLAVEEQYYVLFPIFLILVWRFGKNRVFWTIIVLAVVSLLMSEWGWRNKPAGNFYLAPTRAWELFAGSIAAFIIQKRGVQANNILSLVGLASIFFAIFVYDESTPFPSIYALVPVLGAVLLILFAERSTWVARLLSTKVFVGIGLISYSAYLWHQPLFAFARIRLLEEPSAILMATLSVLSLMLAGLSWRFVEAPFRNKEFCSRSMIFIGSVIGCILFISFGLSGHLTKGYSARFPHDVVQTLNEANDPEKMLKCHFLQTKISHEIRPECNQYLVNNSASVLMIGDSHLSAVGLQIQKRLFNLDIGSHAVSGCGYIRGLYHVGGRRSNYCAEYYKAIFDYAENNNITDIVMIARFPMYLHGDRYDNGEGGVEAGDPFIVDTIEWQGASAKWDDQDRLSRVENTYRQELKNFASKFRVIVFEPTPVVGWHVPNFYGHDYLYKDKNNYSDEKFTHSYANYKSRTKVFIDIVNSIDSKNLSLYDLSRLFCSEETGRCTFLKDNKLLYYDQDHLSPYAAGLVADDFVDKFGTSLQ